MMLKKCRCGGNARIRRKKDHIWIECRKCSKATRYYVDMDIPFDTSAEERAIIEWNEMMGGTDSGNVL